MVDFLPDNFCRYLEHFLRNPGYLTDSSLKVYLLASASTVSFKYSSDYNGEHKAMAFKYNSLVVGV